MSFSPTVRKEFHVDFSDPGCNVRVIAASGDAGVADFRRNPALDASGFYIAIDREQGYVGGAGTSVSFRSSRFTDGAHLPPDLMLGIVGAQTPLEPAQAFALERIAYQALQRSGWRMRNGSVPGGEPLDDEGYRAVQLFWSGVVALLRPAFPSIACPWTGPEYLDASGLRDPYGQRRRASMLGLVASVRSDDAGWCVEAGSRIRRRLKPGAEDPPRVMRNELIHVGALLPLSDDAYVLTRDVRRPTLSSASDFVYTVSGSAQWIPVDDREDDALLTPPPR